MKVSFITLLVAAALLGGSAQAASFANTAAATTNDAKALQRGRKKKNDDDKKKEDKMISMRALISVHNVLHWARSDAVASTTASEGAAVRMDPDVVSDALARADRKINPHARFPVQSGYIEKYVQFPEDGDVCRNDARLAVEAGGSFLLRGGSSRQLNAAHDHTLYWHDQDDWMCPNWLCFDDDDFWVQEDVEGGAATDERQQQLVKDFKKDDWFFEKTSWQHGGQNHHALEAALCVELRNSGDPTMAEVTDCKIDWIYPREW